MVKVGEETLTKGSGGELHQTVDGDICQGEHEVGLLSRARSGRVLRETPIGGAEDGGALVVVGLCCGSAASSRRLHA